MHCTNGITRVSSFVVASYSPVKLRQAGERGDFAEMQWMLGGRIYTLDEGPSEYHGEFAKARAEGGVVEEHTDCCCACGGVVKGAR